MINDKFRINSVLDCELTNKIYQKAAKKKTKRGRPVGGLAWIIRKNMEGQVSVTFTSERISVIKHGKKAFIGVYMPYNDGKLETRVEYEIELNKILSLSENLENQGYEVTIIGDFNSDLARNSEFDRILSERITGANFCFADHIFSQTCNYTYSNREVRSWIDHVITRFANNSIKRVKILQDDDNLSDHNAIEVIMELNDQIELNKKDTKMIRYKWERMEFCDSYNIILHEKIKNLEIQINKVAQTQDKELLKIAITVLINEIHSAMRNAATEANNQYSNKSAQHKKHRKRKNWWDDTLQYIHMMKKIAYCRYKESGFTSIEAKRDLIHWKKEFRKHQRENQSILRNKSALKLNYLFKTDRQCFWRELNKQKEKKLSTNARMNDLSREFGDLFNKKLLDNSSQEEVSRTKVEKFKMEYENVIFNYSLQNKNIENIIRDIPNGKSVGSAGVSGEMFKYGMSIELVQALNILFTKMINHQVIPHLFNVGIIKPIVKNENEDPNDINNLRPITISDVLANIYEKIIITEMDKKHAHNDKQFGFKKSSSCNHAVFTLRESILFNLKNKKKVHIALIDASKAFDKVNRIFLWDVCIELTVALLLEIAILLSVMSYYDVSCVYIENNGEFSTLIITTKGVKQGGPLSPRLFAMYIEKIIVEVENVKEGIWLNTISIDILVYADDIVLLSNTLGGLNRLLKVTENYGKKWEIKFNPAKTVYMAFGGVNRNAEKPFFDGVEIQRVKSVKYLGITINERMSNIDHLTKRKQGTMARLNDIEIFGQNIILPHLKIFLYKAYARPILWIRSNKIKQN